MAQTWCRIRTCVRKIHSGIRLLRKNKTTKGHIARAETVADSALSSDLKPEDTMPTSTMPLFAQQFSVHDNQSDIFGEEFDDKYKDILENIPDKWKSVDSLKQSLEQLDFDIQNLRALKDQLGGTNSKQKDDLLWGTPDAEHPASNVPCGGCGANLHCNDTAIPGYVPQEKFKGLSSMDLEATLCLRCHCLSNKSKVVDVEIDKLLYRQIVKRIRMEKALVLMVIDVTDITNSIIPDFVNQVGKIGSIFILGNKVDVIPKDCDEYLTRLKDKIWEECLRANLNPRGRNIKDIRLISAKTGYGIEDLITKLVSYWETKGNVYLVGTTNSGKSTLFNRFLESDYCKFSCRDIVQRATVSRWPGTTLNLIKFPIVKMRPQMAFLRQKRLEVDYARTAGERQVQEDRLKMFGKSKNAILFGRVGKTEFRSEHAQREEDDKFITTGQQFTTYKMNLVEGTVDSSGLAGQRTDILEKRHVLTDEYPESVWTYDTPGLINKNQIINFLKQDELRVLLNRQMIRPRVFVMKPGDTMFVTGLARVDYLQGEDNTLFAVFTNHFLPVHIVDQKDADSFYMEHLGTEKLGLPLGDSDRLNKLPSLCGRRFSVETFKEDHFTASADLQLSSLGWLSLGGKGKNIQLQVYTPGGRGMHLRQPALLANIGKFMGVRVRGSKTYLPRRLIA